MLSISGFMLSCCDYDSHVVQMLDLDGTTMLGRRFWIIFGGEAVCG